SEQGRDNEFAGGQRKDRAAGAGPADALLRNLQGRRATNGLCPRAGWGGSIISPAVSRPASGRPTSRPDSSSRFQNKRPTGTGLPILGADSGAITSWCYAGDGRGFRWLRAPATTEIDSPHFRGRLRLNRRVHLILPQNPSTDVNAWEFDGNRCGNRMGIWELDRGSLRPAP